MERPVFDPGPEPTWYPCPRCFREHAAKGVVCWDCVRAEERARAQEFRRAHALESIPPGFTWASFSAPELALRVNGGHATIAQARAAAHLKRVVLFGPAGRGKTSLAVAMMREWVDHTGEVALFVPSSVLSGGSFKLADEYVEAPLVVIDDVGSERALASNALPDVVKTRHERGLATWVTTWMTQDLIIERYGDGVRRRIFERGVVVAVGGLK